MDASLTWRDAYGADAEGMTPLHHACADGCAATVRALLAVDADGADAAARRRDVRGHTPLHWCAYYGHAAAARALLEGAGAGSIALVNARGRSAEELARLGARRGRDGVLAALDAHRRLARRWPVVQQRALVARCGRAARAAAGRRGAAGGPWPRLLGWTVRHLPDVEELLFRKVVCFL